MTIGSYDWDPENFDYDTDTDTDTELDCGCELKTIYVRCIDCDLCLQCCWCDEEEE